MENSKYEYYVSGIASSLYPTEVMFGLLWTSEDNSVNIPMKYPFSGEWGTILSTDLLLENTHPIPQKISILWLSIVEKKFYLLEDVLPKSEIEKLWNKKDENGDFLFTHIVVGMAMYGKLAIWLRGPKKSLNEAWLKADEIDLDINDILSLHKRLSIEEYCNRYLEQCEKAKENLKSNGLPASSLFERKMSQFTYRYVCSFLRWNEDDLKWMRYEETELQPTFDFIQEALIDGTHDKLHDGSLLKYHTAGKPDKISFAWHVKKSDFVAYFWFDEYEMSKFFQKVYGMNSDLKTDFIIRVDFEKKKFEISLYRYGMENPCVLPESVYQYIIFKSKMEYCKSDNYNQVTGAWIW